MIRGTRSWISSGAGRRRLRSVPDGSFHSNIHITTSGIFTTPPFNLCLEVVGVDRILFSVDYPYAPTEAARRFFDNLSLAPVTLRRSPTEMPSAC